VTPEHTAGLSTAERMRLFVRVGVFIALVLAGRFLFPIVLSPFGNTLVRSALGTFAAAACANAIVARGWEHGKLSDFGMGWTTESLRQLLTGIGSGAAAAIVIVLAGVALQVAAISRNPSSPRDYGALSLLPIILMFGALGEELMFHGYAFQHLVRIVGEFATVLPVGVLFGLAHMGNANVTWVGVLNTIAWGILLGYAYLRARSLWLPIGLHFGWNLALPLLGVNLSGFTMGLTGYELEWRTGPVWSGGAYGIEGGLCTTAIVIVLFALLPKIVKNSPERGFDSEV